MQQIRESVDSTIFMHVSGYFKTQKMYDNAVEKSGPDYFKTRKTIRMKFFCTRC